MRHHRRHAGRSVLRATGSGGAGADHVGHVPPGAEVRACPAVGRSGRPVPDRSDRARRPDRCGEVELRRYGRHDPANLWICRAGQRHGSSGVKGLNALLATVSSAHRAPEIVATRLWKGSANSAGGAARLVADSLKTTKACGVTGTVILRADAAYYGQQIVAAAQRRGAHFSITAARTAPSPPRSAPSPTRVGRSYPERCSTNSSSSGCPTPRSPRFPSPRSHPAARPVRCGLIDPSRKGAGLWHLTLFDWNRATKPSVRPL